MDACDRCERPCDALVMVEVARETRESPAEYEGWCRRCIAADEAAQDAADDRAYEMRVEDALMGRRAG